MADNTGKYQSQEKLLQSIKGLMDDITLSENEQIALEQRILNGRIKSEASLKSQAEAMAALTLKADAKAKVENKILETEHAIFDIGKELNKQSEKILDYKKEDADASKKLIIAAKAQVKEQHSLGILSDDQSTHLLKELELRDQAVDAQLSMSKHAQKYGPIITDAMDSAKSSTDEFFASFPGGAALSNMLGFDAAFDTLKQAAGAAMGAVVKSLLAGQGPMAALKAGQAAFNAVAMMNPYVLIAAAILLVIGLIFTQNKAIREQAEAQGVSLAAAKEQVIAAKEQVGQGKTILANTQDVITAQNAVNDALGTTIAMNAENAAQVADVGKAMGYGAKVAGESAAAMMKMGASQQEVADLQMETNLMSVKAGVDMGKVQADIAKNAGTVAKYFAGNPKALAKAAVEAQKIGVSLATMSKISDGLLDFEKSISAQFELQAMTGKQMNFDKARQLALEGDILGATKAVMGQIGDIHDFNKMDVLERRKLAEATGMDVEELQKALTIQSMRGDMTEEELARAQGLNLSAAELSNLTAEDLKKKLASQDATAKMAKVMAQLKEQAMLALQPLMDMLSTVMNILAPIMKLGHLINSVLMIPFKAVFAVFKGIFSSIMSAAQPMLDIFDEIGSLLGGGGGGIMGAFEKIGEFIGHYLATPLRVVGTILRAVLLPVIELIAMVFDGIGDIIAFIGGQIDRYFIQPIEKAVDMLGNLNPMNWFSSDEEPQAVVEAMAKGGTSKGGLTLVGEAGPELVTLPGGAEVTPAGKTGNWLSEGLSGMMSMSPMGMAADAMGGLFGGGGGSSQKTDQQLLDKLDQVIMAIQNMEINMDGEKVGSMTRLADTFRRG